MFKTDATASRLPNSIWLLTLPIAFSVLAFFLVLPLRWKDQAILGCLIIASALLTNRIFSNRVTTILLSLSACFCTARYAWYRYSETGWAFKTLWSQINGLDAFFVLLLLAAETYSFIILFLGCFQTSRPLKRRPVQLPKDPASWPTVDIFIPTYNEPLSVVSPTVLAALTIDYPQDKVKVYILDDGRRAEFAQFARDCGANYLTRLDNAHAKAGNINAALHKTSSEHVAVFDCDHVPTRSFLQMTIGALVADDRLGMVQTPHHFYSPDPFERNLGIFRKVPNESALFYGIIQDGNDLWDATFFCGSCAVLRRTALEEIGGIAVETVTEDAHTALRMHAQGWSTSYINLTQAGGLATARLADHVGQRIRWARGMVQILRVDNPLFKTGLKFPQRLCYLNSMLHYLFAGPRFVFLLSPLVYLILGRSNVFGYLPGILAYGLPHVFLSTMVNSRVHGKHRHSFWNEVYEMVLAPYILLPTLLALINPKWGKFNVTAKDSVVIGKHFDWQIAKPFAFLLLLNFLGIFLGVRRIWLEGDAQGVLAVNLVWTFFNSIMLGGALAVANESKQVRAAVRVPAKLPIEIVKTSGERIGGRTENISFGGVVARFAQGDVLEKGEPAQMEISCGSETYTLPIVGANTGSSSLLRCRFSPLTIQQQAMLTRVTLGRADCWLSWKSEYATDRPLMNLLYITVVSFGGIAAAVASLLPQPKSQKRAMRSVAEAASPIAGVILLVASLSQASAQVRVPADVSTAAINQTNSSQSVSFFQENRDLAMLGQKHGAVLKPSNPVAEIRLGLAMNRVVSNAGLSFRYRTSPGMGTGGRLRIAMNGSDAGVVDLQPGSVESRIAQADIPLAPDLFVIENTISFRLELPCSPDCRGPAAEWWVDIDPSTEVRTSGVVVPTPNRLDLLPAPFFTSGTQRFTDIPFVLDASSDARTKQAAGIIASWFGLEANNESIRFQVAEGRFPPGNVVLVATQKSPLVAALGITDSGPSVSIRANPADSSSKVLAIVAESSGSLVAAARAFALQRYSREKDSAVLPAAALPQQRLPYDAPRWLDTSRDVKPAEKMSDSQLEVLGSGRVALYFRLPPDLYYGTRDTVPFHLRYRCTGLAQSRKAFAKLELNGQVIATRPIPAGEQITIHEEIVYLPVASLYPRNTLAVEFDFEKTGSFEDGASRPRAAVLRSSELMVKGLPHFAAMPRLDMLANTGFPYTKFADLAQTLVVLPRAATADDVALYLTMIGFMSAQTGVSALRMELTQDSEYALRANKDLLLIGAAGGQPLLEKWASSLIAQPYGKSFHVWKGLIAESLLTRLPWSDNLGQRQNLNMLLQNDLQLDALVQGFPSPEFPDRSVIAFTSLPGRTFAGLVEDWASVADASQLYGTISLFTGGSFHSFTFGQDRYELGHLDIREAMLYWGRRYYWLSPILIFASMWILTLFCHRCLESRAAERLRTGLRSEQDAGFLALGRQ